MQSVWFLACSVGVVCAESVPIVVSPNVINIDSLGGGVTVHAEIPFGLVDVGSISATLDGKAITVQSAFADNCGDLVVKFDLGEVKAILVNDSGEIINTNPTLVLEGATKFEDDFYGADQVRVIKVSAAGNRFECGGGADGFSLSCRYPPCLRERRIRPPAFEEGRFGAAFFFGWETMRDGGCRSCVVR